MVKGKRVRDSNLRVTAGLRRAVRSTMVETREKQKIIRELGLNINAPAATLAQLRAEKREQVLLAQRAFGALPKRINSARKAKKNSLKVLTVWQSRAFGQEPKVPLAMKLCIDALTELGVKYRILETPPANNYEPGHKDLWMYFS